jgi:preprotein translocase subunit YajC
MRIFTTLPLVAAAGLLAQEQAQPAQDPAPAGCLGSGGITGFLPIIAMVAIFYFLIIRPQQKQQKKLTEMREAMKRGDSVVTAGGIHGVVTNIKGTVATVRIAEGVKVDVDKSSLTVVESSQEAGEPDTR